MLLNTADIPNLYDNEERLEIIEKVRHTDAGPSLHLQKGTSRATIGHLEVLVPAGIQNADAEEAKFQLQTWTSGFLVPGLLCCHTYR